MRRRSLSFVVIGASIALGGCNLSSGSPAATPVAVAPSAPAQPNWPPLPQGAACSDDLRHYQTVLDADVGTGNVNRSVYDEIETELIPAAEACAAGRDSQARSLIHAAKERHGYRSGA
jgi:hypothetical protein